jgi:hypothetical protein
MNSRQKLLSRMTRKLQKAQINKYKMTYATVRDAKLSRTKIHREKNFL